MVNHGFPGVGEHIDILLGRHSLPSLLKVLLIFFLVAEFVDVTYLRATEELPIIALMQGLLISHANHVLVL